MLESNQEKYGMQPKTFYKSRLIGKITSETLQELKENFKNASKQKQKLKSKSFAISQKLKKLKNKKKWLNWFPLSKLFLKKIKVLDQQISDETEKLKTVNDELEKCKVAIEIEIDRNLEAAFGTLSEVYSKVINSDIIWDITTSQKIDRIALRTIAENLVARKEVNFKKTKLDLVVCDYEALFLQNANGEDLYIYPLFIVMKNNNDFALIDLKEVDLDYSDSNFIEEENVPNDGEIIGKTWAKANKDGTRDKRFSTNYQIPVLRYGVLHFKTDKGLNEVYMISKADAGMELKKTFNDLQNLLI